MTFEPILAEKLDAHRFEHQASVCVQFAALGCQKYAVPSPCVNRTAA